MVGDAEPGPLTLFAVLFGLVYTLSLSMYLPRRGSFNYGLVTATTGAITAGIAGLMWLDRGRIPGLGALILIACCWVVTLALWFVGLRQLSGRRTPKDTDDDIHNDQ